MNKHFYFIHRMILTVAIITGATVLQVVIWPYIEPTPILFFYPAILIASLYGEAYTATLLAAFAIQYFFIPPYGVMKLAYPQTYIRILIFISSAFLIKIIADNLIDLKKKLSMTIEALQEEKELREKFVSTLSHDLQTPLSSMKLATALMVTHRYDEGIFTKNHKRLTKNMIRLENMIRDLLDANKIRGGKLLPIQMTEMDINDCVSNTLDELILIFGDRFISQQTEYLKGFWCEDAIQRIIENLCTNAVKYGNNDTPITIATKRSGDSIILSVHNWGPVIEKEERDYIFAPFHRTKSAQVGKTKGWGLGLTLVKGLTEAMQGELNVQSDRDFGTTFIVELPIDARIKKGILNDENSRDNRQQWTHRNKLV